MSQAPDKLTIEFEVTERGSFRAARVLLDKGGPNVSPEILEAAVRLSTEKLEIEPGSWILLKWTGTGLSIEPSKLSDVVLQQPVYIAHAAPHSHHITDDLANRLAKLEETMKLWLTGDEAPQLRGLLARVQSRLLKGFRSITEEEAAKMDCPFPPEPEWQKEWEEAEVEKA